MSTALAALAFLQSFDPDGWHTLVAIHPVTPQVTARTFPPSSWEDMQEWIAARNTSGLNIYFTVNEMRPETGDRKPKKTNIARIRAVWIDVDPPKDQPYTKGRRVIEKTLLALPRCPCPPTHLVDSGGGLQAFWRLQATLPADAEAVAWARWTGPRPEGQIRRRCCAEHRPSHARAGHRELAQPGKTGQGPAPTAGHRLWRVSV